MTPQDHWNLIASDPRLKSDSLRGHDFRPYQAKRFTRSHLFWSAILALGVLMIVGGYMGMVR